MDGFANHLPNDVVKSEGRPIPIYVPLDYTKVVGRVRTPKRCNGCGGQIVTDECILCAAVK